MSDVEDWLVWPDDVLIQEDLAASEWLSPRLLMTSLSEWLSGGSPELAAGTPVGGVVPVGFAAYVRILHPATNPRHDSAVRWREVAQANGRVYHPLMQWQRIAEAKPGSVGIEVYDPMTGHLDPGDARVLYGLLAACTSTPEDCWIGIWNGHGVLNGPSSPSVARIVASDSGQTGESGIDAIEARWEQVAAALRRAPTFTHPGRDYLLARGPCRSMPLLIGGFLQVTPNLAWPDDRAWCVASEIDFDSTLVGASRDCADALLSDDQLEAVEVTAQDRLDIDSDTLNDAPPLRGKRT